MNIRSFFFVTAALVINASLAAGQEWQLEAGAGGPGPRAAASMTTVGDDVLLFGGVDENNVKHNDLWRWDHDSRSWVVVDDPNPPSPRFGHTGVAADGKLWVLFGQDGSMDGSMWSYDPAANQWQDVTPAGVELEVRHKAAVTVLSDDSGDEWILFAGGTNFFFEPLAEVGMLRVRDLHYEAKPDLPTTLASGIMFPVTDGNKSVPTRDVVVTGIEGVGTFIKLAQWMERVFNPNPTYTEIPPPSDVVDEPGVAPMDDGSVVVVGGRGQDLEPSADATRRSFHYQVTGNPISESIRLANLNRALYGLACSMVVSSHGNPLLAPYALCFGGRDANFEVSDETYSLTMTSEPGGDDVDWRLPISSGVGIGVQWKTTMNAYNSGDEPCGLGVERFPCDGTDGGPCVTTFDLDPDTYYWQDDALDELFGVNGTFGASITTSSGCGGAINLITRISSSDGTPGAPTRGQGFVPFDGSRSVTFDNPVALLELRGGDEYRTNVGVISREPSEIRVNLFSVPDLDDLGTLVMNLGADEFHQFNRVLHQVGADDIEHAMALVEILNDGGRADVYGSVVNSGGDAVTVPPAITSNRLFEPSVANVLGLDDWSSSFTIRNPFDQVVDVRVRLLPNGGDGGSPVAATFSLEAFEVWRSDDVLDELFETDGSGALVISATGPIQAASTTRAVPSADPAAPSSGQSMPAVDRDSLFTTDDQVFVGGLSYSPNRTIGFRANAFLANLGDEPIEVVVSLWDGGGFATQNVGNVTIEVPAGGFLVQTDIYRLVTQLGIDAAFITTYCTTPDADYFVGGVAIDNRTGDGSVSYGQLMAP